jgi:quercetin dioxygenase-like cupin family protein
MAARLRPPALAVLATVVAVAACTAAPAAIPVSAVPAVSGSVPPVVRDILAAGDPSAAPGSRLELARYTIQPGTRLATHRHPGMQLARVESGVLTYTVVEGVVTVHEPDGGTRRIGPGRTGSIETGEWIAEHEGVVHYGENAGTAPVVILASSLLEAGQPPALPVETPTP